ncbi:MAG: carboxypeptidase regulatory-like domain-containing protein [Flavobacteriales bacterium]
MVKQLIFLCTISLASVSFAQGNNPYFSITSAKFNTSDAEIGVYKNSGNNALILVSSKEWGIVKRVDANEQHFFNYFTVDEKSNKVGRFQKKSNSKFNEGPLSFTPDGKRVFFTRNSTKKNASTQKRELMLFTAEVNAKGKWSNISTCNVNNNAYSVGHPAVSKEGDYIVFASEAPGGQGGTDLYVATLDANGFIGEPMNLGPKVNTKGNEFFPWFSPEGQLFFSSNGLKGLGGYDLFVTELKNGKDVFNPMNLEAPINSASDDIAIVYHADMKGYVSSNRDNNNDNIYSFTQLRPIVFKVIMSGIVTDLNTNDTLKQATLNIKNQKGDVVATLITDEKGSYNVNLEPDQTYTVEVQKENHKNEQFNLNTDFNTPKVKQNVALENRPNVTYTGIVTDTKTKEVLQDVKVTLKDLQSGKEILVVNSDINGGFSKAFQDLKYGEAQRFEVKLEKKDYATKIIDFNYSPTATGSVSINDLIDLSIGKVEVGVDLSKLMQLGDIYFDYGKFDIREDASVQLEKIVSIMNEYPAMVIELGSHTDCRGAKDANKKLSDNRAKASADYIRSRISNPTRISGIGYGEAKLKVNCPCEGKVVSPCPEEEHAKNRRTEFIVKKVK